MQKKSILLSTMVLASALTVGVSIFASFNGGFNNILASSSYEYNHYAATDAGDFTLGLKEYWISCGEPGNPIHLEEPTSSSKVNETTLTDAQKNEILLNKEDPRIAMPKAHALIDASLNPFQAAEYGWSNVEGSAGWDETYGNIYTFQNGVSAGDAFNIKASESISISDYEYIVFYIWNDFDATFMLRDKTWKMLIETSHSACTWNEVRVPVESVITAGGSNLNDFFFSPAGWNKSFEGTIKLTSFYGIYPVAHEDYAVSINQKGEGKVLLGSTLTYNKLLSVEYDVKLEGAADWYGLALDSERNLYHHNLPILVQGCMTSTALMDLANEKGFSHIKYSRPIQSDYTYWWINITGSTKEKDDEATYDISGKDLYVNFIFSTDNFTSILVDNVVIRYEDTEGNIQTVTSNFNDKTLGAFTSFDATRVNIVPID